MKSERFLGAAILTIGMATVAAAQQPGGVIEVLGEGRVDYDPDQATVVLAVTTFGPTAQEATQVSAEKMTRVQAALARLGVEKEKIRTTGFRLEPHYPDDSDTRRRQPEPDGYTATNALLATVDDIGSIGSVIDAAIDAGADRVDGLQFGLEDPAPVQREALAAAVRNAREQAEVLAAAAGVQLGPIVRIGPPESPGFPQPYLAGAVFRAEAAPSTPIAPGTLTETRIVSVTYRIE